MSEPKDRSSFLLIPFLIAGALLLGGIAFVILVPIQECFWCDGMGERAVQVDYGSGNVRDEIEECGVCRGRRRFTLFQLWRGEAQAVQE